MKQGPYFCIFLLRDLSLSFLPECFTIPWTVWSLRTILCNGHEKESGCPRLSHRCHDSTTKGRSQITWLELTHGRSLKTRSPRPAAPDASKTQSTLSCRVWGSSSVPGGRSREIAASAWVPGWARLLFIPTWILITVPAASPVPAAFLEGSCFNKAGRSWHADTRQDYRGARLCCVHFHFNSASPRRLSLSKEDAAHWAIQSK